MVPGMVARPAGTLVLPAGDRTEKEEKAYRQVQLCAFQQGSTLSESNIL
jgi:hypothetical protein